MMELRCGLPKVAPSRNGGRLAPSCGSMVNVRISPTCSLLHLVMTPRGTVFSGFRQEYPLVSGSRNILIRSIQIFSTSSSIIQEVEALHNAGMALMTYFYCDFRDTKKQDVHYLLGSLLAQLSGKSDPCYEILSALYSKHDAGSRQPNKEALAECLENILKLGGQPPIYIVMDAIDECPNTSDVVTPRDRVLELVEKLIALHLPNLRICLTSRPEADIRASLGSLASHTISLHDESGQRNDISDYVSFVVHSDRNMRRWRAEDKKLVIETLSRKADGM